MLIILSEHASIYREEPMKKRKNSRRAMKRGYIARRLARRSVRKLRSFGASRAKPETNIGFNPLHYLLQSRNLILIIV